jgi:voltage-gated potassium channel
VRSTDTPEVSVVEEALNRYRDFLSQWRSMHEQQEQKAAAEAATADTDQVNSD